MGSDRRRTGMASKKHRPEEAVAKLRQVDVLVWQGRPVAEAIRAIGVTEVTYYRWRREFGGLKLDQVKRLKELEAENARLRKAVADLTLDKQTLAEAARGNFFSFQLDFAASGRVAGEVRQAVEHRAWHFLRLAARRGRAQSLVGPDRPPDRGQRVADRGGSLGVPGRGARQKGGAAVQLVGPERHERVEPR